MSNKFNLLAAIVMASVVAIPAVFAVSEPNQVYQNCKNEAEAEEVESANMQSYIRGCMKENGVDAAGIEGVMKEMMPSQDEGQKSEDDKG